MVPGGVPPSRAPLLGRQGLEGRRLGSRAIDQAREGPAVWIIGPRSLEDDPERNVWVRGVHPPLITCPRHGPLDQHAAAALLDRASTCFLDLQPDLRGLAGRLWDDRLTAGRVLDHESEPSGPQPHGPAPTPVRLVARRRQRSRQAAPPRGRLRPGRPLTLRSAARAREGPVMARRGPPPVPPRVRLVGQRRLGRAPRRHRHRRRSRHPRHQPGVMVVRTLAAFADCETITTGAGTGLPDPADTHPW